MIEGKPIIAAAWQVAAIWLVTVILAIGPLYAAHAAQQSAAKVAPSASQEAATPPQIAELTALLADPKNRLLLTLLADPTVQKWMEKQGLPAAAAPAYGKPDESVSTYEPLACILRRLAKQPLDAKAQTRKNQDEHQGAPSSSCSLPTSCGTR